MSLGWFRQDTQGVLDALGRGEWPFTSWPRPWARDPWTSCWQRAKQLLQEGGEFSLAQLAACAGFSDQSVFSHHFNRIVGVTPGQFRTPARIT